MKIIHEFHAMGMPTSLYRQDFPLTVNEKYEYEIVYTDDQGQPVIDENLQKPFKRYRLSPEFETDGYKYHQYKGSGLIPYTTGLFRFNSTINWQLPTILVEGEKKAYALCYKGYPAIGLPGITSFYSRTETGQYSLKYSFSSNETFQTNLNNCNSVSLLLDQDWKHGTLKRKKAFISCISAFYHTTSDYNTNLNLCTIKPKVKGKGIDDAWANEPKAKFDDLVDFLPLNNKRQLDKIRKELFYSNEADLYKLVKNILDDKGIKLFTNEIDNSLICDNANVQKLPNNLMQEIETITHKSVSINKIQSILKTDFISPTINPLKAYFHPLNQHDKKAKSPIEKLCSYVHLENENQRDFFVQMIRKHMIRCVRTLYDFDYSNRIIFVLVSHRQEIGKSKFWEYLCPLKEYYNDHVNINSEKDTLISLSHNFIINLDDLEYMKKIEIGKLKSLVSNRYVRYRPIHGPNEISLPRLASFVGTSNRSDFLIDNLNTRFVIFEVVKFDWTKYYQNDELLKNCWQEAHTLFQMEAKAGELTMIEKQRREQMNENHIQTTSLRDLIIRHFTPDQKKLYTNGMIREILERDFSFKSFTDRELSVTLTSLFGQSKLKKMGGIATRGYFLKYSRLDIEKVTEVCNYSI